MIDRAPGAHSTGWFRVDRPFGLLSHYTGTPLWPMPPRRAPASVARHSTSWPAGRARLFGIDSHNRGARPATPSEVKFAADSLLEGAVRCELVSAAGSDSAPYEFLESIKKEGPQPSDALPPFPCNLN